MKKVLSYIGALVFILMVVIHVMSGSIHFEERFAYVMYSGNEIIGGQVSEDEQWRIQCEGDLPPKLEISIKLFEDQYFDKHFGINPISIAKAMLANIRSGKTVRGGSTLTMQLARIHERNQARTYLQKCKEMLLALALEYKYSKREILELYAQHAPFGGNTIGYCAAARRYYGKSADDLSWSEATTLAVLPNAPSDIYPGRSQKVLKKKRNFLLKKLLEKKLIDSVSYRLSCKEDLPQSTLLFNNLSPHLLQEFKERKYGFIDHTTLDYSLQKNVQNLLVKVRDQNEEDSGISNVAAIVIRNDGTIASYVANTPCRGDCSPDVNLLTSLRSPGSTLKPFLYARAMEAGIISETSLLEDKPVFFNGFSPKNFDLKFRGLIPAQDALTSSLNVPAINLLAEYGTEIFLDDLRDIGFNSLEQNADYYGLSLILGGGEVTPLELGEAYMNLARSAQGKSAIHLTSTKDEKTILNNLFPIQQGTASIILRMLQGVNRPESHLGWKFFTNQRKISWKTGTSYGFRDAWAVGVNQDYTVVVWVGNADGEGRQGLTGINKAAPVLFSIFDLLPTGDPITFAQHAVDLVEVCAASGYLPNGACDSRVFNSFPKGIANKKICPYHEVITLNREQTYRVNAHCISDNIGKSWFVVDPVIKDYYKSYTGIDLSMPPTHPDCNMDREELAIIYPTSNAQILLPRDLDKRKNALICKATAGKGVDSLYWFVDNELHSITNSNFKIAIDLSPGPHIVTVVTPSGQQQSCLFSVVE